jgi:hypothetical protein
VKLAVKILPERAGEAGRTILKSSVLIRLLQASIRAGAEKFLLIPASASAAIVTEKITR